MPTSQPNNAPDDLPSDMREDATFGAVLADGQLDDAPGGGGLGGGAAAAGDAAAATSGTSPNSPLDVPLPAAATDETGIPASAAADARREAVAAPAPESHPSSL